MSDTGRFARQYVHTSGRTLAQGAEYALEALAECTEAGRRALSNQQPMRRRLLELARSPISIAEAGAHLGVHVGIVRVLVSDVVADGLLRITEPSFADADGPDIATLQALLQELEGLGT
jgi:Protein of unknown function (DUF742)